MTFDGKNHVDPSVILLCGLSHGENYAGGLCKRISTLTNGYLAFGRAGACQRLTAMKRAGFVTSRTDEAVHGRPREIYSLTLKGRAAVAHATAAVIDLVIR